MAQQTINIGASPNDGTGTPLRTAFQSTNSNFTELYTALGGGVGLPGATTQVIFNDGGTNLAGDAGLVYNKTTDALTVAGLVTAGSATISGALTVDTSTLKVDAANNRVGIGTATPAQPLHVRFDNAGPTTVALFENQLTDVSSSAAGQIVVGARNYNYTVLRQNPDVGTSPTIGGSLDTVLANISALGVGYGKLILATQNTARLSVHETTGDVSIANGNLVMTTSGKGIDFAATTEAAGMTSELLNDYEEGTWTGTLTGGTTDPTVPVTATGRYTKVGRIVSVQITFTNVNTLGASGLIGITGLPFTNNASVNSVGSVNFYNIATFTGSPFVALGASQSSLVCYSNISNSAFGNVTHNASASANYFTASITYSV